MTNGWRWAAPLVLVAALAGCTGGSDAPTKDEVIAADLANGQMMGHKLAVNFRAEGAEAALGQRMFATEVTTTCLRFAQGLAKDQPNRIARILRSCGSSFRETYFKE